MEKLNDFVTELGGSKKGFFSRNKFYYVDETFPEEMDKFIKEYNNTDIYQCMYYYQNTNIDTCPIISSLYFDFDGEIDTEYDEMVREVIMTVQYFHIKWYIPIEHIRIYFSGAKGFHLVIPYQILGIKPASDLNEVFKNLAEKIRRDLLLIHLDKKIYDRKRLFRLPGSINSKTGLRKTRLTYEQLTSITLDELKSYASEPHDDIIDSEPAVVKMAAIKYKAFTTSKVNNSINTARQKNNTKFIPPSQCRELLPCVLNVLENGVLKGNRNNSAVAIASSLLQSGMEYKLVIETMESWNEINNPPLPHNELMNTAKSAKHLLFNSGMRYGCSGFKTLGLCIGGKCIAREIKENRNGRREKENRNRGV